MHLSGRRLSVRTSLREVVVYLEGSQIACHARSYVPADVVLDPAHARGAEIGARCQGPSHAAMSRSRSPTCSVMTSSWARRRDLGRIRGRLPGARAQGAAHPRRRPGARGTGATSRGTTRPTSPRCCRRRSARARLTAGRRASSGPASPRQRRSTTSTSHSSARSSGPGSRTSPSSTPRRGQQRRVPGAARDRQDAL